MFRKIFALLGIVIAFPIFAHFQVVLPDKNIVEKQEESAVALDLIFCHPFEGDVMNMVRPAIFGVSIKGEKKEDLLNTLIEHKIEGKSAWKANYKIKHPGDYVFYLEPKPYWEPAEEKFIVHYTKVVVDAFGLEEGWDAEIGLKTEIIPLTRPYGLYSGNVFRGLVKVNGKPVPFVDVEVEYYNKDKAYTAPGGPYVTQVVRADANGVFCYAIPKAGWWGFAALSESESKMKNPKDGKEYPIETGALIWVKTEDMK